MALLAATGCATRLDAARARFIDPDYVVTKYFYDEAPQRVAVLPFATRTGESTDIRKAELCRRVFYQHMALRDYEDVELHKFDASVFQRGSTNREPMLGQLVDVVRMLDVVGMTTVLDLQSLFGTETLKYSEFNDMVRATRDEMHADAYVIGITRSYGRLYAVLVSSIGISTRLEMRSATTGNLMWRGEEKKRNYEIPLTLNPFDIPRLLFDVWRNSRGLAMDSLAYEVYGDLSFTMPYMPAARKVYVEPVRRYTPYFRRPTLWLLFPRGRADPGERFEFRLEQNGWYECVTPGGELVWMFRGQSRLVDEAGSGLDPHADLTW